MRTTLMIAVALTMAMSPVVSADDDSGTQENCIEDGDGNTILCVSARAWTYDDGHVQGRCRAYDAEYPGTLDCTDSDDREDVCTWTAQGTGCNADLPHDSGDTPYKVTATGCVGASLATGPFTTTVVGHTVHIESTENGYMVCTDVEAEAN